MLKEQYEQLPDDGFGKEETRKQILENEEFLKKDIRPIWIVSPKGFHMIYYLISFLGALFVAIIVIIITSDTLSS